MVMHAFGIGSIAKPIVDILRTRKRTLLQFLTVHHCHIGDGDLSVHKHWAAYCTARQPTYKFNIFTNHWVFQMFENKYICIWKSIRHTASQMSTCGHLIRILGRFRRHHREDNTCIPSLKLFHTDVVEANNHRLCLCEEPNNNNTCSSA